MLHDLIYGLRMIRKTPGWSFVMGATLTLAIGLTTVIFSLAYGILLHALPYPNPQRLVTVWLTNSAAAAANVSHFNVNAGNWIGWRSQSESFEDIALARPGVNFNLTGDGEPERVQGARTSWNLPEVLGVKPLAGRMFTAEETTSNARVAVITFGFWQRRFGGDPAVLGRTIQLNDEAFEVIGIMPQDLRYPSRDIDLLAPLFITPEESRAQFGFNYRAVGRLKPGVTIQRAQAEV